MKPNRHEEILKLISEERIETQEELASRLKERGFSVTQATISRDIRKLNLLKVPDKEGRTCYRVPRRKGQEPSGKYIRVLREALVSMELAGNILVIKTASGMAMAAAATLDEWNPYEIAGCIAGDDTIMCAVRSVEDGNHIMEKIKRMTEDEEI